MAQLTAHSSTAAAPRRTIGRPFRKGQSGNPSGRPKSKGLVKQIRELTADGADLAVFIHKVFAGKVKGAKLRDRLDAASWLADRAYGRPQPQPSPVRFISANEAHGMIDAVAESVKRHVTDRAALQAISADLARYVQEQQGA